MKTLYFNKNQILLSFSEDLKLKIKKLINDYLNDYYNITMDFDEFDTQISDLILQLMDERDLKRKKFKHNYNIRYSNYNNSYNNKKFKKITNKTNLLPTKKSLYKTIKINNSPKYKRGKFKKFIK